jgi:hypothetical protein
MVDREAAMTIGTGQDLQQFGRQFDRHGSSFVDSPHHDGA